MIKSLFHWKVLLNLLLAVAVFAGLVWLTFVWLAFHTNHGKETPVPNVVNMSIHDAVKVLDDAGLEYEVDSLQFNPKYKPFQVLRMYPTPGSRVKNGRQVQIIINPRTWAPVQVPDIIDRYKGLAFRQLEQVGLKVGDTIFEPNIQRDAVIRMQLNGGMLKPGALVPRFSVIDVVIGTGPKRNVAVPNLVGLTVQEAMAIITNNLFEVGLVEHEDGGGDKSDIVYYQDPEGGALRDQGMQVDLWSSKKTPAQMGGRISQLNAIYRVKIDTTLPPIQYKEVPVEDYIPPAQHTTPAPKTEQPKAETHVEKPKTTIQPAKTEAKPKTTTPTAEKKTTTAEEKPKAKKVIVE